MRQRFRAPLHLNSGYIYVLGALKILCEKRLDTFKFESLESIKKDTAKRGHTIWTENTILILKTAVM